MFCPLGPALLPSIRPIDSRPQRTLATTGTRGVNLVHERAPICHRRQPTTAAIVGSHDAFAFILGMGPCFVMYGPPSQSASSSSVTLTGTLTASPLSIAAYRRVVAGRPLTDS